MARGALLAIICFSVIALQLVDCYSHYCPRRYTVRVRKTRTACYRCGCWWRRYRCCRTVCYYTSETRIDPKQCCPSWRGARCNIPICRPSCQNNALCYDVNKCYCRSGQTGRTCGVEKCSFRTNCYPGTCRYGASDCACSGGFEGTNCNIIRDSPDFKVCQIRLLTTSGGTEKVVFTGRCNATAPLYSNQHDIKYVVMDWKTVYDRPTDIPHKPPYIGEVGMGVISTDGRVVLKNTGQRAIYDERFSCQSPVSPAKPYLESNCPNVRHKWTHGIAHRYSLEATMTASTGGFKTVLNTDTQQTYQETFTGATNSKTVVVTFDFEAPKHCSATNNCTNENNVPIDVAREIDNNKSSTRQVMWAGWTDVDSGLELFSFEVFALAPDSEDLLTETSVPVQTGMQSAFSDKDFPSYTLSDPGMYSVVLKVEDSSGNAAFARGLFLWDSRSNVTVTGRPMTVSGDTGNGDGFSWLTSSVDTTHPLGVNWHGHFENAFQHDNKLLNKVKKWPVDKGIDDLEGNRTLAAIPNINGIVQFYIGHGHVDSSAPTTWIDVEEDHYELRATITDGDFIRVFVKAVDVMGNNAIDSLVVGVDSSLPRFVEYTFQKNVESGRPLLPYSSRINMKAYDRESGIRSIQYIVNDVTTGTKVWNGTVNGQKETENTQQCLDEGTCDCTPMKECYYLTQAFYLDNCWFLHGAGHEYQIDATIFNHAGLSTATQLKLGALDGFSGVNMYPTVRNLTVVKAYGNKVEIWWEYVISCDVTEGVKISYKTASDVEKEVTLPAAQSSYVVEDLDPNNDYSIDVVTVYEGGKTSQVKSLQFNSGDLVEDDSASSGGLAMGAIVGIVIVMWILVVVIVLLVLFIITRRRQNQPYMPRNLHDFRRTMRQSMFLGGARSVDGPQTGATTVQMKNNLSPSSKLGHNQYTPDEADDDDVYLYGNMVTDSVASWKIPAGNVELVQRLPNAKGRFADIYQATLTVKNGKQEVVAKRLKQRGNANDEILMTAKMNFFATACPKHENILLFVGAVTQGPVLLFELCDLGRLREWLVAQTKVTEDLEDKMITIGLHIARGMKQLHSHEIVHRRLGARNVLLKSAGTDVIIAKIAGFGPMKGEQATLGDNDNEKIPVKWMALEQLSVAPGERRKYDEKTDVWSYGVTLWEIFSKGEVPYSDKSSRQLKAVLDSGYRMPRPTHCQDTMYDQIMKPCWSSSASSRPSFADVVNKIEKLFTGGAAGDEYYYDISKKGQGQAVVEDDGLYQNNIVRKP